MKTRLLAALACAAVVFAGCTSTAGPFVTSISSDGRGGLIVEKAMVEYNYLMSTISTKDPSTTIIYIQPTPAPPTSEAK